jgi:hypothetical protein
VFAAGRLRQSLPEAKPRYGVTTCVPATVATVAMMGGELTAPLQLSQVGSSVVAVNNTATPGTPIVVTSPTGPASNLTLEQFGRPGSPRGPVFATGPLEFVRRSFDGDRAGG